MLNSPFVFESSMSKACCRKTAAMTAAIVVAARQRPRRETGNRCGSGSYCLLIAAASLLNNWERFQLHYWIIA
ncbi:hypothetical protein Q3G72_000102 [Acer saccharum]|nr:hypothetical protein Q3G72_000102 [Acer saccharum]